MSEFERGIQEARVRQHRLYILTFVAFSFVGLLMAGVLVSTSGTPVKILPIEAEETGTVMVEDGYAFSYHNVVYGLLGRSTITVQAKGFREQRRQIEPEERGNEVAITMAAIPGRLIASTVPAQSNTRWSVDGDFLFIGESFDRELEHGTYALRIDNPYFKIAERGLKIKRAETQEITLDLIPVDGQIIISSDPQNASINVNDQSSGQTPNSIKLKGGEYSIVVEKEGYVTVREVITLTNIKANAERTYRLKHVPSTLAFSVEPEGGELLLNGRKVDPSGSYEVSSNVKHTLTYIRDGYHPLARTITLKAGENKRINVFLKPDMGDVEIHASPSAEIYVDGIKIGEKLVTVSLSAIVHAIELRKPGYRSIKKTVKPSSRRKTVIREKLSTELAARKAESPKEYKNSAEIELKLFEPGPFKMGAPRDQKGQRANEFERNVILKKAFYSSKHEITNSQFILFRKDHTGPANEPVTSVTWLDAAAFSNWISKREGLSPFYKIENRRLIKVNTLADGYRLLTEAEWEWLARKAGRKEQTIFPWGDDDVVPRMAGNIADESANGLTSFFVPNYNDGYTDRAPVGMFPAEASGLFDLTGNVSEWVHDFYTLMPPDKNKAYVDPLGPGFGEGHVIKGANWRSGTRTLLRAAYRNGLVNKRDDVGFRIGRYLYADEATNTE